MTPMEMAKLIELAVQIHENSFDHEASETERLSAERMKLGDGTDLSPIIDFSKFYTKTLWGAVEEAVEELDLPKEFVQLVDVMLYNCWNDAIYWAEDILYSKEQSSAMKERMAGK